MRSRTDKKKRILRVCRVSPQTSPFTQVNQQRALSKWDPKIIRLTMLMTMVMFGRHGGG